jgi:hypothetical protein
MRFVAPRPLANPDTAARKVVEIAKGVEAMMDGRIYIELVNAPFLAAAARISADGSRHRAGWLWRHEGGTHAKFTEAGAALIA